MLEVERRECHTKSKSHDSTSMTPIFLQIRTAWRSCVQDTFYSCWKEGGGNIVPSMNRTEVELCEDGLDFKSQVLPRSNQVVPLWHIKRTTHYLQTTAKHGWNESFLEKIVGLQNTMKTMLHTICWSSEVSCLSSSVHAKNPFEFIMETAHLAKVDELSFAKCYETSSTHYSWCIPTSLFHLCFVVVRE